MGKMELNPSDSLVIRMDNGPQMTSNTMFNFALKNSDRLIHELIPVQTPNKDAHIESFYSILETECFQVNIFKSYLEGYSTTYNFIEFYNNERIHGSLGYRTPMECLTLYRMGSLSGIKNIRL
jgi:transposase InsO family protein